MKFELIERRPFVLYEISDNEFRFGCRQEIGTYDTKEEVLAVIKLQEDRLKYFSTNSPFKSIESYDPATKTWETRYKSQG